MSVLTTDYLDAVRHLPSGATLIIHAIGWDEYERLLDGLSDGASVRVSYDRGRLEAMSPLPEHEDYIRFIDDLVRAWSDRHDLKLEKRGSATWKRPSLERGVEADACYYVGNADRIIGKRKIDLESDPPPDIALEIDVTNESMTKFPIYAALGFPEIWRYDGSVLQFYALRGGTCEQVSDSPSFPALKASALAAAIDQSKIEGQTAALAAFRRQLQDPSSK